MDILDLVLVRMEASARRLDLILGETAYPPSHSRGVPAAGASVFRQDSQGTAIPTREGRPASEKNTGKTRESPGSVLPAAMPEESSEHTRWENRLYPPAPESYREFSEQMLEDMRRRSTLPLDEVRTVIL